MSRPTLIVALSGGKDSTALALRLRELNPKGDYKFICTPTGDELPEMIAHWKALEKLLGPIEYLGDKTIYELIDEMKMLPNWRARWCTRILKIEAAQEYYEKHAPAVIYVGLRADEPGRTGNKLYDKNIVQRFPLQSWGWGINEVKGYLSSRGVTVPRRTDCAIYFFQRIDEWFYLWRDYPGYFKRIEDIEKKLGYTLLSPGKWKNWTHALKDLRSVFEAGRVPIRAREPGDLIGVEKCRACTL